MRHVILAVVAASLIGFGAAAAAVSAHATTGPGYQFVVGVRLTDHGILFTRQQQFYRGAGVEFEIVNQSSSKRWFNIGGRQTKLLKPKAKEIFFLGFDRRGKVQYRSWDSRPVNSPGRSRSSSRYTRGVCSINYLVRIAEGLGNRVEGSFAMRRPRSGLIAVALTLCAACGLLASFLGFGAGSASGAGSGAAAITKVTVIATEFHFKLSKTKVPVGTVIFTVENKGKIAHDFKIGGKRTPLIPAGKKATLTVVFKKKGRYAYLCTIPGHAAAGMKGTLAVGVAPPTTTGTTTTTATIYPGPGGTVTVSMFEFGFTLTPSTIPSGNVTFVMTNNGTTTHNFDIETISKPGPFLDPGQTASETVNLEAGRTYTYVCDVPFHAEEGMEGTFTPTP